MTAAGQSPAVPSDSSQTLRAREGASYGPVTPSWETPTRVLLAGCPGIAVGRDEGDSSRQEIVFDPDTGQFIGEREVLLTPQDGVPAGEATTWSALSTGVVDSAPAG